MTVATGALTMTLVATQSAPAETIVSKSVRLLSTSSDLQPFVDQLVAAQHQVTTINSAYPFITSYDLTTLPAYTQNLGSGLLYMAMGEQNLTSSYNLNGEYFPVPWNAPGTNPQPFSNSPNPDDQYNFMITNGRTITVTISPQPGTKDVTFVPMSGTPILGDYAATGVYDLSQFTPNADGTYTVTISPTQQSGNWIDSAGATSVVVRDTIGDWGLLHSTLTYTEKGASTGYTLPVLTHSQIASMLNSISTNIVAGNAGITNGGIQARFDSIPANHFTAIQSTPSIIGGPILPSQLSSAGHFSLQSDQALIVKVPNVVAAYSDFQLSTAWMNDLAYVTAQGSLNDTDTFQDSDGYTYYIVSSQNPGLANWVDNSGALDGNIFMRFQDVTGSVTNAAVTAQVVPIADVAQYLPTDTPTVAAAQYANSLKQRVFEYDYTRDQMQNSGWVTSNLEIDQIKAAIGTSEFNQVFGSQTGVPSVLSRMFSSSLTPDIASLANTVLTNPGRSLGAIVSNLPLATQDIIMPMVLATLRLDLLVGNTAGTFLHDLFAGKIGSALTALGSGVQKLGALVNQTLTDPATSIPAGFLNARDDLAVSITNAAGYSPLSLKTVTSATTQIGQVNQSAIQMLVGGLTGMLRLIANPDTTPAATSTTTSASTVPTTTATATATATTAVGATTAAATTATATAATATAATATAAVAETSPVSSSKSSRKAKKGVDSSTPTTAGTSGTTGGTATHEGATKSATDTAASHDDNAPAKRSATSPTSAAQNTSAVSGAQKDRSTETKKAAGSANRGVDGERVSDNGKRH